MNKKLKKLWKEIEELPHDELFDLLFEYDKHVIDQIEPVCVLEFYTNDYEEIRKQRAVIG